MLHIDTFHRKEYAILNRRKGLSWKSVYWPMQQIAQLFIVLLMGYVVVKAGLLKASDSRVLSVVFRVSCHAMRCSQCIPNRRYAADSRRTLVLDGHSCRNACRVSGPQCHL